MYSRFQICRNQKINNSTKTPLLVIFDLLRHATFDSFSKIGSHMSRGLYPLRIRTSLPVRG